MMRLGADDRSVTASARREIDRCFPDHRSSEALAVVRMLLSELVTNAVDHGRPPIEVRVALDHVFRIEVDDASPSAPRVQGPDRFRERGRGMLLVDALSSRWGVHPTTTGKTVWAEVV